MELRYEVLLLLQIGGIFMMYNEYDQFIDCSFLKLLGRLFILTLPTILYINLKLLNEAISF